MATRLNKENIYYVYVDRKPKAVYEDKLRSSDELLMVVNLLKEQAENVSFFFPYINTMKGTAFLEHLNELNCVRCFRDCTTKEIYGVYSFTIADGGLWWGSARFLQEVFVLSMDSNIAGIGRIVSKRLIEIAEETDTDIVQSGGLLPYEKGSITNTYMKQGGYTATYPCFVYINKKALETENSSKGSE